MQSLKSFLQVMSVITLLVIAGCQYDNPVGLNETDPQNDRQIVFSFDYNPIGTEMIVDTLKTGQQVMMVIESDTVYDQYTWDFGDGAVSTGKQVLHKYQSPGLYTACVTAWLGSNPQRTICRGMYVLPAGYTENPVFVFGTKRSLNNGRYQVKIHPLRRSCFDCPSTPSPFTQYSHSPYNWGIRNISRDSSQSPGRLTDTFTVHNYDEVHTSYGGANGCFAFMGPLIDPAQNNIYWVADSNTSIIRFISGDPYPINATLAFPGPLGDELPYPVIRVGLSPTNEDSLVIYCNLNFVYGSQTQPFIVTNATGGLTTVVMLKPVSGFPGWYSTRIHKDRLENLANNLLIFKYGGNYSTSWADMSHSGFINSLTGNCELNVQIFSSDVYVIDPISKIKTKLTSEKLIYVLNNN